MTKNTQFVRLATVTTIPNATARQYGWYKSIILLENKVNEKQE
jgi:hypothetical protein